MKKCKDCEVEMIEKTNLHTDYVGGVSFEEQIYLDFINDTSPSKGILENETENIITERVRARLCPKCGKIELFVDINKKDEDEENII